MVVIQNLHQRSQVACHFADVLGRDEVLVSIGESKVVFGVEYLEVLHGAKIVKNIANL